MQLQKEKQMKAAKVVLVSQWRLDGFIKQHLPPPDFTVQYHAVSSFVSKKLKIYVFYSIA